MRNIDAVIGTINLCYLRTYCCYDFYYTVMHSNVRTIRCYCENCQHIKGNKFPEDM